MTHELKTGGDRGYLRIATEEAWATQEQLDAILRLVKKGRADKGTESLWGFYGTSPSERTTFIRERLVDIGELRIQAMDESGIDKAVLALTSPGVQTLFDDEEARRIARNSNNKLKDACERYPDRFYGMIAVAPQDPEWSVEELKRGKEELGFHGVQINSHTKGHYLDEPQFDPILRACAELDLPLYIHPQGLPDDMIGDMVGAGLDGAIYGFAVETSYHAMRLLTTGVFDRYPNLQLMLGHGCEGLPFMLYRLDYMHKAGLRSGRYPRLKPLQHDLFHYMRNNVLATNSGLPFGPAIKTMIEVMGEDRVMYAMDYPYQFVPEEVRWMDDLDITDAQKKKFFQTNAERWFKLLSDAAGELRAAIASYWKPHAIACAARLGIADAMDGATDAADLARTLELDPQALARFLRALAAIGLVSDEGDGTFALTGKGAALRVDHPRSVRGMALHMANDLSPAFARLHETVRTGLPPQGIAYGPDGFAEFERDEVSAAVFNQAMVDNSRRFAAEAARAYDFTRFDTIMDVGGGYGAVLAELLKAASDANGCVLDLAHAESGANRLFAAEDVADRARFVEASFFEALPETADCYVLKYILHDWDDVYAARIVTRVAEAARASSGTVILIEKLMPERVADDPAHAVALQGDMTMMLWNGKERTERAFAELFAEQGLSLTRTVALSDNHFVIEAMPG